MKKFFRLSLVIIFLAFFNRQAFSCDALNITIGTEVSKVSNIFRTALQAHNVENHDEDDTFQYRYPTMLFCKDLGLDNTMLNIFVLESKIIGLRLETWNPSVQKNKIYEFANAVYGNLDDEVTKEDWTGYRNLGKNGSKIFYSKYRKYYDGIYETLDISTDELIDYTYGESVIEINF